MGASDVVTFEANSQQYIVFANREDNDGNPSPNVDSLVFIWDGSQFERVQVWHVLTVALLTLHFSFVFCTRNVYVELTHNWGISIGNLHYQ